VWLYVGGGWVGVLYLYAVYISMAPQFKLPQKSTCLIPSPRVPIVITLFLNSHKNRTLFVDFSSDSVAILL
jgi:hypothetical protein